MSEKANPRRTGLFVIGAIVLFLAALLALASGTWFKKTDRFAAFFEGSVRGLQIGAPVTFRGVQIGEVKDVSAVFGGEGSRAAAGNLDIRIEVILDLEPGAIRDPHGLTQPIQDWDAQDIADWAVERGFVATLATQSLLTGLKYIDLEFRPGEPARLTGLSSGHPELPTRQTEFAKIQERLATMVDELSQLPVEEIGEELVATLQAVRQLAESPQIPATLTSVGTTMEDFGTMARNLNEQLTALIASLEGAAGATRNAMVQTGTTMERVQESTGESSRLHYELYRTLDDLGNAAEALRLLAEFLEQHPEAILSGRGEE